MSELKFKVITNKTQYKEYSNILEDLVFSGCKDKNIKDEIALLTLLIEKWDAEHNTFDEVDPIHLLHSLMKDHKMKAKDLVNLLEVSKGYVSDILNYKKGLSKDVIRKLAERFKVLFELCLIEGYPILANEAVEEKVHVPQHAAAIINLALVTKRVIKGSSGFDLKFRQQRRHLLV